MAKENKLNSKIPIPVNPLPLISTKILKRTKSVKLERHPLETLYHEPENKGKTGAVRKRQITGLRRSNSVANKIDTKNVTLRQQNDDLDWNFKVFNDPHEDKKKGTSENLKDGESSKALTPVPKTLLEPSRVRNIKRSLKRPHSRELQGISPAVSDDKKEEKHRRRLNFTERFEQPTDFWLNSYASRINQDYGPDLFDYLLKNEKIRDVPRFITNDARTCILNWLVKVNGAGGNPAVIQTTAWYFDHLFTSTPAQTVKFQLMATACYWLALKIQGNLTTSKALVRAACYAFDIKALIQTERALLKKLDFPVQPIVAQDFISYMSWVCDASSYWEIERTATLLYMAFLLENKQASTYYPSFLAAASIKNALCLLNKEQLISKLEKNAVYKTASTKEPHFKFICSFQLRALRKISSPSYEYRALLENSQDRNLTKYILNSVNKY